MKENISKNEPLISVIVPVYNVEKYLGRCVDSIINQTYTNLEIILVDDGSTDDSRKICDEYAEKDGRIKVIHKSNGGQGSARNMALDIAKGQYIGFVDSDDWLEPDMYEYLYHAIKDNFADISVCGTYRTKNSMVIPSYTSKTIQVMDTLETLKSFYDGKLFQVAVWDKLYQRELWDEIRFPNIFREDIFVTFKVLAKSKKTVHIGAAKYNYFIRNNSSEHQNYSDKFYNSVKAIDIQYEELKDLFPELKETIIDYGIKERILEIRQIILSGKSKQYKHLTQEMVSFLEKNKDGRPDVDKFVDEIKNHRQRFCFKTYFDYYFVRNYKRILRVVSNIVNK